MKKLNLLFIFILFFGMNQTVVNGEDLAEIYLEGGYKETNVALKETEDYLKLDIPLPTRLPPVAFTHNFGQFSTLGIPQLEITYLNENSGTTHYKILITSLKYKQEFKDGPNTHKIKLSDGIQAVYVTTENFNLFVFEKGEIQYTFMVDNLHPDEFTKETLVKIADSIQ